MNLKSERTALTLLSETVVKSGVSLFNAIKYIYAISDRDFYNINVKDIFRVALNNITDTNCLHNMGIRIDKTICKEMNSPEYERVLSLIVYSFAVRLPVLKDVKIGNFQLNDVQIKAIYELVISKGAENWSNTVPEDFDDNKRLVKTGKPLPTYNAEWFKAYIYTHVPELGTITNRNMFLLGSVDILFTLFYSCFEEEQKKLLTTLVE